MLAGQKCGEPGQPVCGSRLKRRQRTGELVVAVGKDTTCLVSGGKTREGKRSAPIFTEHVEIRICKVGGKGSETGGLHEGGFKKRSTGARGGGKAGGREGSKGLLL